MKNEIRLIAECSYEEESGRWISGGNLNGLFYYDKTMDKLQLIDQFPEEKLLGFRLFKDINKYMDKLVFAPCYANSAYIYDINKKKFDVLSIPESSNKGNKYMKTVAHGNKIYLFPYSCKDLLVINVEEGFVETCSAWSNLEEKYGIKTPDNICIDIQEYGNLVFVVTNDKNLICVDINTEEIKVIDISKAIKDDILSFDIADGGKSIWILTNNKKIIQYSMCNEQIENEYILEEAYTKLLATCEYLYLFDVKYGHLSVIKTESGMQTIYKSKANVDNDLLVNAPHIYGFYDIKKRRDIVYYFDFLNSGYYGIKGDSISTVYKSIFVDFDIFADNFLKKEKNIMLNELDAKLLFGMNVEGFFRAIL